ncbi:MAG: F-type H+-transporting ATPase subunit epsilon [Parcubacteria group bacterium Athens0416_74]|jgi:F-type H+-transporting ATPase subunit epsilon|nr:MAG: F-type H+-transporting ATPase subunit epsilon [Parcubacteria group bacterium Athens0416_74]
MAEHSNTFHLVIASVGETIFDGAAISATIPGDAGEFTILPSHEPLVTTLKKGFITVKTVQDTKKFDVESGVLECSGSRVVILL